MAKKIFCFINCKYDSGDMMVESLCEDGEFLESHLSSSEGWAKHDIGITSDWKHDKYKEHCPDGYELIWVDDPKSNEEMKVAYDLHLKNHQVIDA